MRVIFFSSLIISALFKPLIILSFLFVSDRLSLFSAPGQIGTLQATQMSHEATIKDLQQEQSRLREKIVQLEEEKDRLQSQSQALDEQQRLQILNLEKVGHIVLLLS